MKSSHLFSAFVVLATCFTVQAAPDVSLDDLSPEKLKAMATARQQASIKIYEDAKAKTAQDRADAIKKSKEITEVNNAGLKKTIQKRALNNMLPRCEREPETPRTPNVYEVRGAR